ncbi:MAG: DUF6352 family protein [Gemmobacter sp.]
MTEFWVASGHHLTRLDAAGRMLVTDGLLLAWLARPELKPPPEACAAERALHRRLMSDPSAVVDPAGLADPDGRENWALFLALRDTLLRNGTVEGTYLDLVRRRVRMPHVFLDQLVQLILRNALDGCADVFVLRAAEMLFRPQRGHVRDGALVLADAELVEELETQRHVSPLTAMLAGGAETLDVLGEGNAWTYWSRSDAHSMALNFGGDRKAREGLALAIERFLGHLMHLPVRIEPVVEIRDEPFRWFVGLDQTGTAIGNALWRGADPPSAPVGLFRLSFLPGAPARLPEVGQAAVWLILGPGDDMLIRMKPQNLVTGLPLAAPALH